MQFSRDGDGVLKVGGSCDINAAGELRQALLDGLQDPSGLAVDLCEVDSCDAATLQLLTAVRKSAAQLGRTFRLTGVSAAVEQTVDALALTLDGRADCCEEK